MGGILCVGRPTVAWDSAPRTRRAAETGDHQVCRGCQLSSKDAWREMRAGGPRGRLEVLGGFPLPSYWPFKFLMFRALYKKHTFMIHRRR